MALTWSIPYVWLLSHPATMVGVALVVLIGWAWLMSGIK